MESLFFISVFAIFGVAKLFGCGGILSSQPFQYSYNKDRNPSWFKKFRKRFFYKTRWILPIFIYGGMGYMSYVILNSVH